MNIIEKYVDRKLRRVAYISMCKNFKEKDITQKSNQESIIKKKILVKQSRKK